MEADKVKEITDRLEDGIKDLFESEQYEKYLKVMSKFHRYSMNNSLLIAMQKPDATMVAGYTSWQANFHRQVRKGEHGISILAPSPYKISKDIEKVDPETNKPVIGNDGTAQKERVEVTIPAYKVITVFDVSQTEGEPLPEIANNLEGDVNGYGKLFDAIKEISPVPISVEDFDGHANGYFDAENEKIVVKEGLSQAQTLKTAIHELAHAKLHDKDDKMDRRTKEVQAESVAYTVCSHFGLDTSDYSFGYIAGWSKGRDMEELKKSLKTIRDAASGIIKGIDEKLHRAEQEEKIAALSENVAWLKKDIDPAGAAESIKDQDTLVETIRADIKAGNVEHIKEWFEAYAQREEPVDICIRSKKIIKELDRYSRIRKGEERSDQVKDEVKNHHRRR